MRKNNKGSSLILVIIVVAMIGILGSVILSTTMFNYEMKAMNLNSKDNFYSAETALEEIRAGLQENVSKAFSKAYIEVLQQYSSTGDITKEDRFKTIYAGSLREQLKQTAPENTEKYNLELLKGYLVETAYSETTGIGAKIDSVSAVMEANSKGVTLKDIIVLYTDEKNYVSKIRTDLVLLYPELSFSQTASMPNLLQYCLIANTGLQAKESMMSSVKGNVYSGSNGMDFGIGTLTFQSGSTVITKGALSVAQGANIITEGKVNLWSQDINIQSANLTLKGTTYVANDLTVRDQDALSSKITIANEYYGFGNEESANKSEALRGESANILSNPADYSSAMIINGRNVTMDLSGIKRLLLGGNAYIGSTKAYMGESLTVKSNQLAYLVPGECIGIGTNYSGMNPMPKEYFLGLQTKYGEKNISAMVDFDKTISKYGNKTLRQLGVSSVESYCAPGGQAYFYMLFDTAKQASKFYQDYYAGTKESEASKKLNEYLKLYVDQIKVSSNSQIKYMLNGNAVTYSNEKSSYIPDTLDDGNGEYVENQEIGFQDAYAAYCTKLINSYYTLSTEEKALDVYANLVNEQVMLAELGTNSKTYFVNESNGTVAVAVDNQNAGSVPVKVSELSHEKGTVSLILATGDVIVDQNFNGLVLAKGTVTVKNTITITKNQEKVLQALQAVDDKKKQPIAMYLKNSQDYLSASTGDVDNDMLSSFASLEELICYENWTKE